MSSVKLAEASEEEHVSFSVCLSLQLSLSLSLKSDITRFFFRPVGAPKTSLRMRSATSGVKGLEWCHVLQEKQNMAAILTQAFARHPNNYPPANNDRTGRNLRKM